MSQSINSAGWVMGGMASEEAAPFERCSFRLESSRCSAAVGCRSTAGSASAMMLVLPCITVGSQHVMSKPVRSNASRSSVVMLNSGDAWLCLLCPAMLDSTWAGAMRDMVCALMCDVNCCQLLYVLS